MATTEGIVLVMTSEKADNGAVELLVDTDLESDTGHGSKQPVNKMKETTMNAMSMVFKFSFPVTSFSSNIHYIYRKG